MNTLLDTECSAPVLVLSELTFLSISEFTVSSFRFQNIESNPSVNTGFYRFWGDLVILIPLESKFRLRYGLRHE